MCEKPLICLFLIWHVLGPLKTIISACMRARLCVCQNEGECLREGGREGGRGNSRAVDSKHFFCCFYSFFSLLYVQYTFSGYVTKSTISAVRHIEVSSG